MRYIVFSLLLVPTTAFAQFERPIFDRPIYEQPSFVYGVPINPAVNQPTVVVNQPQPIAPLPGYAPYGAGFGYSAVTRTYSGGSPMENYLGVNQGGTTTVTTYMPNNALGYPLFLPLIP